MFSVPPADMGKYHHALDGKWHGQAAVLVQYYLPDACLDDLHLAACWCSCDDDACVALH